MTFDKAAYWEKRKQDKLDKLVRLNNKTHLVSRIVCRRCRGSEGQLIKETFFCRNGCDQNPLWDRIVGFFGFGNWRVIYRDGERSISMTRKVAEHCRVRAGGGLLLRTHAPVTFLARVVRCKDEACEGREHLLNSKGEII